ncbi:hypothetical protein TRFO_13266 [Tritrichomonas foetus]|uniref:Uncharacterized protein n=1 Tax=Tritrichomonas foetus TaxID=1144522 RepID=A0A1J4L2T5_9EUKA|nr:hypothetical protein TRFO_13266 [Tritrichomonas foetus]|eukprot:OHT16262.1 hypothetical protein TRFO_13266 [Tritrichomonas foetus]
MENSQVPTLSISIKKTKVFGKAPPSDQSVGSTQNTTTPSKNSSVAKLSAQSTPKSAKKATPAKSPAKSPTLLVCTTKNSTNTPKKSPRVAPPPIHEDQFLDEDSYDDEEDEQYYRQDDQQNSQNFPNSQKLSIKMNSSASKQSSAFSSAVDNDHIEKDQQSVHSTKSPSVHSRTYEKSPSVHSRTYEKAPSVRSQNGDKISLNGNISITLNSNEKAPSVASSKKSAQKPKQPPQVSNTPNKSPKMQISMNSKNSKSPTNYNSDNEDHSYDYSPENSPKRISPVKYNSKEAVAEEILPIVNEMIGEENPLNSDKVKIAADQMVEWQKRVVKLAAPIEESHKQLWFSNVVDLLEQQNMAVNKEKITYYDQITLNARELIQKHRFSYPGGTNHRFKIAVTGPNVSGKTTFVSVLAQQLLLELAAAGDWKSTFIFPIDVSSIAHLCQDLSGLFQAMAQLSFQALAAQKPLLTPYAEQLTQTFESIVTTGSPLLPKNFVLDEDFRILIPQIQQLIDICLQCYRDPSSMTAFVVNTFMLPYFLSLIFGFKHCIIIADHFDLADVTKAASPPFEDTNDNVFMAEIFKFLFNQSSFIIGAKFNAAFMEVLTSIEAQNTTFSQGIEFVSTLGIVDPHPDEYTYNLTFENDEEKPVSLNSSFLGGCALLLNRWNQLSVLAKRIDDAHEQGEESEIDEEEERLNLINHIQSLLKSILLNADGSPYNLSIKSVTTVRAKNDEEEEEQK